MAGKRQLVLNCEICDSTRMKEENYSHYEEIVINAEILVVNAASKGMLNRLPIRLNIERTIESAESPEVKVINGTYEMTAGMLPQKTAIVWVNGFLRVCPGTEEALKKYECIIINGTAEFPEGMKASLDNMIVNGQVKTYPDDSVVLEDDFILDSYFPVRAREGMKYFARNAVRIQDSDVDISRLLQKDVKILTPRLIVPEKILEEGAMLVPADTDFVVVPEGMSLVYGNAILDEELISREGGRLFVYGSLKLGKQVDMELLQEKLEALIVTGDITLYESQREEFRKIHARYKELQVLEQERLLQGMAEVRLNRKLFEASPDGICIGSAVRVVIEEDVTPGMLQDGLHGINCLQIVCNQEQREALLVMGVEPWLIQGAPEAGEDKLVPGVVEEDVPDRGGEESCLDAGTGIVTPQNIINAECYVM